MTKFFTFDPDGSQSRRLRTDLDGRGAKAMPQPCISCHGGRLRPLDRDGNFVALHAEDTASQIGDVKARLQAFETDTFEFSAMPPYRRSDVEEGLRKMNEAIYCTYPGSAGHLACTTHGGGLPVQMNLGEWSGDIARDILDGWYGNALATAGAKFSDEYVPAGWMPTAGGAPVGADALFKKVIGPNCFVCHGKQGVQLGTDEDVDNGKDVDFETWDKFIAYADDIERLVYDEGRMPLGLLNYQNFWDDPQKAELLASFIAPYVTRSTEFEARRTDASGNIILPGRIVARAGPDRVTQPNAAITLDAQASLFADSYFWELVSAPAGAVASIASPNSRRTDFSADQNGKYSVRLTASASASATSRADALTIQVDNTLGKAPRALTFYTDISDELNMARAPRSCVSCHQLTGGIAGVPMWWTDDNNQPFAVPPVVTPSPGLYEVAMARVMPTFIEDSLLLKKSAGQHHYGRLVEGFDTSVSVGTPGRASYDKFVNWIAEGAKCGLIGPQCP
jgi:mono/diheme cytochrome c family protein